MDNLEMQKRFQFFSAICDIVKVFGETEIGNCEVDEDAIAKYCCSDRFWKDHWNCNTKEDIYEKLTNDIILGFPVWEFLKVSDWTKNMLEKSFATEQTLKWKELCKKYKCYTCKFYNAIETGLGLYEECIYKEEKPINRLQNGREWKPLKRRESFEPKKSCKNYKNNNKIL